MMITLYKHQCKALEETEKNNKCAYYLDMGLGKTFVGSEKLATLNNEINLVVCQKSKIADWLEHFNKYYNFYVFDLTNKKDFKKFFDSDCYRVGIINYDLITRRDFTMLKDFTLMLDESSLVQNIRAKRTKCIMKMKYKNLILLSGTPTAGRFERLYSQLKMLGYKQSKYAYYDNYIKYRIDNSQGFPLEIIYGYKNIYKLKKEMKDLGCVFMKSDEVISLPEQNFYDIKVKNNKYYKDFLKNDIVKINNEELVGDTTLTKILILRQICSIYNSDKIKAFEDLIISTNDRIIVFYNFNAELNILKSVCTKNNRKTSEFNGSVKDLDAYENVCDSVTLIQYQSGSLGLNLQKSNKIVYFSPTLASDLYEQSKKRIHRIGQEKKCFYYKLIVSNSIEENIYKTLELRKDYTNKLFEKGV